jgi:hypothetical protein
MPGYNLHQLDQRTVAVEFPFAAQNRVVRGHGRLVETEETGGTALHVAIQGLAEQFELIFDLDRFSGLIEHGERFACDFAIRLDQPALRTAAA